MTPSFLHTLTAFWLDFEGPGPSGWLKKREKTVPGKLWFFGLKRKAPKSVFCDFRVVFGVDFGVLGRPKNTELIFRYFLVSDAPPWTILGPLLARFWSHFGTTFVVSLEVFFLKNVVLLAWELIFQKFRRISWFLFCWRAFQK